MAVNSTNAFQDGGKISTWRFTVAGSSIVFASAYLLTRLSLLLMHVFIAVFIPKARRYCAVSFSIYLAYRSNLDPDHGHYPTCCSLDDWWFYIHPNEDRVLDHSCYRRIHHTPGRWWFWVTPEGASVDWGLVQKENVGARLYPLQHWTHLRKVRTFHNRHVGWSCELFGLISSQKRRLLPCCWTTNMTTLRKCTCLSLAESPLRSASSQCNVLEALTRTVTLTWRATGKRNTPSGGRPSPRRCGLCLTSRCTLPSLLERVVSQTSSMQSHVSVAACSAFNFV